MCNTQTIDEETNLVGRYGVFLLDIIMDDLLIEKGNLDPRQFPVTKNPKGGMSATKVVTAPLQDGTIALIPEGGNPAQHFGRFASPKAAEMYARIVQQEMMNSYQAPPSNLQGINTIK